MDTKIIFNQKWIEKAVRNLLQKETDHILKIDIEKIKYLKIGESEDNGFIIEMSLNYPPTPFADTDGGDEWECACIESKDIPKFLNENEDYEDIQLSIFGFDYKENEKYIEYISSDKAREQWEEFKDSIFSEDYCEDIEDDDAWDEWYENTEKSIPSDISLFKGVQVLRLKGMIFENFNCFKELTKLEVLETVETCFSSSEGIDNLNSLKQLCCWLD